MLTQQTNIPCEKLEQRFETLLEGGYIPKQMEQIDECSWMNYAMSKPSQRVTFNDNTKQKNRFSDIVPICKLVRIFFGKKYETSGPGAGILKGGGGFNFCPLKTRKSFFY